MGYKDPLNDGKSRIELINSMGNDLSIVNDARASFDKSSNILTEKDIKLINKVHKRALRAIHGLFSLDYNELINTGNTTSTHVKHLQILMTEVFKSLNYTVPQIMCDLLKKKGYAI